VYKIKPPEVIILDRVQKDPRTRERLGRLMEHIDCSNVVEVDYAGLAEIVQAGGWNRDGKRTGQHHTNEDPAIVFNVFRWNSQEQVAALGEKFPALGTHHLLGTGAWGFRDAKMLRERQDCVCQSAYEIHCAFGCLHNCQYCHVTPLFNIMLNLEELAEKVKELGESIPHQNLYKFDNATDQITLEPEYGASQIMVKMFSQWAGRYLLLYTKSDNVEHLLDLDHRGHTLICWSVVSETVCREIEKKTPSLEERIRAMELCQNAGYPVRIRFSPLIPLKSWREEFQDTVERVLSRVRPDVISVDVIGWMDPEQMKDALDMELFDPDYVTILDRLIEEDFQRLGKHIFPHEMRAEILRFIIKEIKRIRPEQPVSLCVETAEMWKELGPLTGMKPQHYVCCCGPTSVPGHLISEVKL